MGYFQHHLPYTLCIYMEGLCYKCSYLVGLAAALADEKRQEFHPERLEKSAYMFSSPLLS